MAVARGDPDRPPSPCHVKELPTVAEIETLGQDDSRTERSRVLGAAEVFGLLWVLHQGIQRWQAFSLESRLEMFEAGIDLAIDLKAVIVAKVVRRVPDQIGVSGRRISVVLTIPGQKSEADARGQER